MVQFSFRPPNADYLGFEATPEGIITTACKAEALGFDAVLVNDHIIVDGSPRSAVWANTYDPLIALAFIAAHTTRIRLGTAELMVRQADLREACAKIGRRNLPATRMSFRVDFSDITGNPLPSRAERPTGQGTPRQVAEDMQRYRHEAGVEAFQINFNGCHGLDQLLASMDCFMQEVKPLVEP